MKKILQEYILYTAFKTSIDREELLISKCNEYLQSLKPDELKDMINEFKKLSYEHIKIMKDKMIKLNVQG